VQEVIGSAEESEKRHVKIGASHCRCLIKSSEESGDDVIHHLLWCLPYVNGYKGFA